MDGRIQLAREGAYLVFKAVLGLHFWSCHDSWILSLHSVKNNLFSGIDDRSAGSDISGEDAPQN